MFLCFGFLVLHMRGNWSTSWDHQGFRRDNALFESEKWSPLLLPWECRAWRVILYGHVTLLKCSFIWLLNEGCFTRDFDPWLCTAFPLCCLGDRCCFEYGQVLYDYFISYCKAFWETSYERQYKNKLNWTMASPPHFLVLKPLEQKVQCCDKGQD